MKIFNEVGLLMVSYSLMLLYQEFIEKYIFEIWRQNIPRKYKEKRGSVSIPPS